MSLLQNVYRTCAHSCEQACAPTGAHRHFCRRARAHRHVHTCGPAVGSDDDMVATDVDCLAAGGHSTQGSEVIVDDPKGRDGAPRSATEAPGELSGGLARRDPGRSKNCGFLSQDYVHLCVCACVHACARACLTMHASI